MRCGPIAPLYIVNPLTYEDSINYLKEIGAAMGRTAEAEEAAQRFLSKLEDYRERSPKDRTALVMYGSDVNFGIDTEGALTGGLLAEVTGYPWPNPSPDQGGHASRAACSSPWRGVLSVDPDVIFVQTMSFPRVPAAALGRNSFPRTRCGASFERFGTARFTRSASASGSTGRGTRSLGLVLDEAMPLLYPNVFGN